MNVRSLFFAVALYALSSLQIVRAFNFTFLTIPAQCEELSIAISGGVPPYRLLIIPIGSLLTGPEIRTIVDRNITGTSDSFIFNYPAASQFIAMMSDSTGIGTGGTSAIIAVGGSGEKSECLQTTTSAPKFYFHLDPEVPTQCGTTRVWWTPNSGYTGKVHVYTMVVGGQSGALTIPDGATEVNWVTNIRVNTTMLFVAGDEVGVGTGGSSALLTIGAGSDSCINESSPSSTQRPPAGGINTAGGVSTPTTTSSPSGSGSGGSSNNIGAIVGGVIGGVAGVAIIGLVLLFFHRRRKHHRNTGTRPMKPDLIDPSEDQPPRDERAGLYEPEPFIIPEPTYADSERHSLHSTQDGAPPRTSMTTATGGAPGPARAGSRLSITTMSELGGGPAPSSQGTRKTGMPPTSFRPVNFIQHDDGGEIDPTSNQEAETIELPPAYTDFRNKTEASGSGAGATTEPSSSAAGAAPAPAATTSTSAAPSPSAS